MVANNDTGNIINVENIDVHGRKRMQSEIECTELKDLDSSILNALHVIYAIAHPSHDNKHSWYEAKKFVGLFIIDKFIFECNQPDRICCPSMPDCCDQYVQEYDIQTLKKYKAYCIWDDNGSIEDFSRMEVYYLKSCNWLFRFCDDLKYHRRDASMCSYYERILKKIDRRKSDRRANVPPTASEGIKSKYQLERRTGNDRRRCKHLGCFADIFNSNPDSAISL